MVSFSVSLVFALVVALLLLYGIYQKSTLALLPAVILSVIGFILLTIGIVFAIMAVVAGAGGKGAGGAIGLLVFLLLVYGIYTCILFKCVVFDFILQNKTPFANHHGILQNVFSFYFLSSRLFIHSP